jgi:hypothetical protein
MKPKFNYQFSPQRLIVQEIINSIQQSPSLKAKSHSDNQEIPRIL